VRSPNDAIALGVEIGVGAPRHRRVALVPTSIPIGAEKLAFADDEDFFAGTIERPKATRLFFGNFIEPAKNTWHN
jgi:hypothetical protein